MRRLLFLFARVITAPCVGWYVLRGRRGRAFRSIMQAACLLPGVTGSYLRLALLRWMAEGCGSDCTVAIGTLFSHPQVRLGNSVHVGAFCNIGWARIADYALIGSGVHIISGRQSHFHDRVDIPIALQGGERTAVSIGYGAWIGNGAIVMADIGEQCVIGAGSVVTRAIPAWSIAVGSPARTIGDRRSKKPGGTAGTGGGRPTASPARRHDDARER